MIKVTLDDRMIEMAKHNLEVSKKHHEDQRARGATTCKGPRIDYQWNYMPNMPEFEGLPMNEFPHEVEFQGNVFRFKALYNNGFGIYDLTLSCDETQEEITLSGLDVSEGGRARAIVIEAVRLGPAMGIQAIDGKLLQKDEADSPEQWIDFGTADLDMENMESFVVMDGDKPGTIYALAHVKTTLLPAVKTRAVTFRPRPCLEMTYLAVKDNNGPNMDDIVSIRNIRHSYAIAIYGDWEGPPICRELIEQEEHEDHEQHADSLN